MSEVTSSEDFIARRNAARARLDAMNPHLKPEGYATDPTRAKWFSTAYEFAQDDPAKVPWARLAGNPHLLQWLEQNEKLYGLRALDVGCGLGDNAEALAKAGAKVVAFDYAERAVQWAKERFPESPVAYHASDLFRPPEQWRVAFDLVHECYTLQALPPELLPRAAQALASFVATEGRLLVITSARENDEPQTTPWRPLTRQELDSFAVDGLVLETLEDFPAANPCGSRHWRAVYRRVKATSSESPIDREPCND